MFDVHALFGLGELPDLRHSVFPFSALITYIPSSLRLGLSRSLRNWVNEKKGVKLLHPTQEAE